MERSDIESLGDRKSFKDMYKELDAETKDLVDKQVYNTFNAYVKRLRLSTEDLTKSILDVGTGGGGFIYYLREYLNNDKAYGIDKKTKEGNKCDDDFIIVGDALELPFENESFEIVVSKHCIPQFLSDEIKMFKSINELIRVAKKGGKIVADISSPEAESEYLEDTDNQQKNKTRYENSIKLQDYINALNPDEYQVSFVNLIDGSLHKVVAIEKLV